MAVSLTASSLLVQVYNGYFPLCTLNSVNHTWLVIKLFDSLSCHDNDLFIYLLAVSTSVPVLPTQVLVLPTNSVSVCYVLCVYACMCVYVCVHLCVCVCICV